MKPGLTWAGLVWAGLGWPGLAWAGLNWPGLVWPGLGWPGLAWAGLSWVEGAPCGSNLSAMAAKCGAEVSKATCFTTRSKGTPFINTCQMRSSTGTLPPWPVDGTLWGSNLSAMAAKCGAEVCKSTCFTVRVNGDPPINTCQMRGSTSTLPTWPIDGVLCDSNLSAMAAKCGAEISKATSFTAHTNGAPP